MILFLIGWHTLHGPSLEELADFTVGVCDIGEKMISLFLQKNPITLIRQYFSLCYCAGIQLPWTAAVFQARRQ